MKTILIALMFLAFLGCQTWRALRVNFDRADKVKRGDLVLFGSTKIGSVKEVKTDVAHRAATIIIQFDKAVQIPMSSEFVLAYDAFGTPFITINASDENGTIDWKQVQHGKVRDSPSDATRRDSLRHSPDGLRPSKKN
jgi:ABC-type transporter Mla subunit MlaD